ncbi:MAG: glutamate synthase-related protein, partial [Desulfobacteraceae bacterium]|nr:glutamate synthase-related protein [Desulfobacteraceae bacterium]
AKRLGTLMALPQEMINSAPDDSDPWLVPMISTEESDPYAIPEETRIVEISWNEEWARVIEGIERACPSLLISVRIPMDEKVDENALSLARNGVSIIHLEGAENGLFMDEDKQYIKDGIRSTHLKLVEAGIRDQITLLASGGIAMAEHVPKAVICGADGVLIDFPILIALECRMCRRCTKGLDCPVEIDRASPSWVASRVINLVGAWHNQLLEVMGAMGIRDARRLRGEVGRAMFFEELDQATFGSMGEVEDCELE